VRPVPRAEAEAARRLPRLSCGSATRTATGVTPSRWQHGRQLGCRADAGPHQLQREVSPPTPFKIFVNFLARFPEQRYSAAG